MTRNIDSYDKRLGFNEYEPHLCPDCGRGVGEIQEQTSGFFYFDFDETMTVITVDLACPRCHWEWTLGYKLEQEDE